MMQVYETPVASPRSPVTLTHQRTSSDRHAQLLTPLSHFPSRMLPPPGTTPRVLPPPNVGSKNGPSKTTPILAPGTHVEVRRFNLRSQTWMPWTPGVVVARRYERFHVGLEVEMYDVQASCQRVGTWIETYIPYVGELRDGNVFCPSDDARDMYNRIADMKKVFARVDVANADGTMTPTWSLAIVESRRSDPIPLVFVLSGPLRGQKHVSAPHILPYTPETAAAVRKSGQVIYWETGSE